ncbi:MAG: DUF4886 domain-containing protein [Bacteroidales bacterium]|nr:DUF4886 domain-containing protein [Bacteroidales bacterium]
MRIIRLAFLLLASLALSCGGNASVDGGKNGPEEGQTIGEFQGRKPLDGHTWKVLFIGNSLTLDATYLLPSLLNTAGVKNIELDRIYHGAYTLPLYNNNYAGANICSWNTWKPGQERWRGELNHLYSPKQVIEDDAYDIICIQEYTGVKECWEWTTTESVSVNGLISKIRDSQKLKGNDDPLFVYLFSTQLGRGQARLVENFDNDPVKMFDANVATISQLLASTGIKTVISTGALQQNLRTTALNTERDMTRGDYVHMDYGAMRWAGACLVFKTLFTPITGIKIEDIPFGYDEYYPRPTLWSTPVTDEIRPILLEAIQAAYDKPLRITDMSKYSTPPTYTHKPGTVFLDESNDIESVTFPVVFPVGNGSNDSANQPYWSGYGIWICKSQPQAYIKWNFASYPNEGLCPTRNFASTSGGISSPALRGLWTGDWYEFVLPIRDMPAGTQIRFSAPFYTRQGPVFWAFEWLDGDEWKNDCHSITMDSFTREASFALKAGTTNVSCVATFSKKVDQGKLRFRVRCVDGTIQADSATLKAVQRQQPNLNSDGSDYSSVFYFHDNAKTSSAIRFELE